MRPSMRGLEYKARRLAEIAHFGQFRKDGITPYFTHPERVAAILTTVPHSIEMKCAALLHDVVEDTPCTLDDLRMFGFPEAVVQMVDDLTKKEDMKRLRAARKTLEAVRLSAISPDSMTIKLADIIDNLFDLNHDQEFCDRFVKEESELLPFLAGGDTTLMFRAKKLVEDYYAAKECDKNT